MTELCKFLRVILGPPSKRRHLFSLVSCRNGLRLNSIFIFNLENKAYRRLYAAPINAHTHLQKFVSKTH